MGYYV